MLISLLFAATALGIPIALSVYARTQARTEASSFPWASLGFALVPALLCVLSLLGFVDTHPAAALFVCLVCASGAVLRMSRGHLERLRERLVRPGLIQIPLVLLVGVCATLSLELPSNPAILDMYPLCFVLEWWLLTSGVLALFFLSQRRGMPASIVVAIAFLGGLAQYFVIAFKAQPIQPGDLSALSTAAAVGAGYQYVLSTTCLVGLGFALMALVLLNLVGTLRPRHLAGSAQRGRVALNLALGLACVVAPVAHVTFIDYYNTLYVRVYTWRPLDSYAHQGFLPCFISSAQTIAPKRPAGYSLESAKQLIAERAAEYNETQGGSEARTAAVAQFDEEKPCVIAVMNETFADLSIYQNMHASYEGPSFFKSLSDTLARGRLFVSAYGGGTANSEFEFLTGNSMAFLGPGVYPYTIYDLTRTENLAAQFKQLGYKTLAMHPNHASNWNRENVYRHFGFDSFLSIGDFQGAETLRGMVTDRATYDRILQELENDPSPQFIFDVTMQNHSGYDTGMLPADKRLSYPIDGVADPEVDEFLSLIHQSDEDLRYLISRLRAMKRKVILVFFGDHQPFFPDRYNDAWFSGESVAEHAQRLWQTDYIIWANYEVAGSEVGGEPEDLSTNYLSSHMMEIIGAPLSDYQRAHRVLRHQLPLINSTVLADPTGRWHLSQGDGGGTLPQAQVDARRELAVIQFAELFGDGSSIFTKDLQSAANETNPNLAPKTGQRAQ
ncbi:LTA synthase family protein [Collinsella sp. AGMB00827]|uniref:LTA synthase family protein n=1 Tax=Collinsella ureilytica TaxID=2869515 RepID=A0ABS7MK14_9ACTN|nr:LTA synthase family protein [Collinsella urealyticum]MBY4797711.1 LTA synthase family protein [Collinsella urealyticum]